MLRREIEASRKRMSGWRRALAEAQHHLESEQRLLDRLEGELREEIAKTAAA